MQAPANPVEVQRRPGPENIQRLQRMELYHDLTPAILAYDGIQYRYLAPNVLEEGALAYLQAICGSCRGFTGCCGPWMA